MAKKKKTIKGNASQEFAKKMGLEKDPTFQKLLGAWKTNESGNISIDFSTVQNILKNK